MQPGRLDQTQVWVPRVSHPEEISTSTPGTGNQMIAAVTTRTLRDAAAEDANRVAQIARVISRQCPPLNNPRPTLTLLEDAVGDVSPVLRTPVDRRPVCCSGCVNVAGLQTGAGDSPPPRICLRLALGCSFQNHSSRNRSSKAFCSSWQGRYTGLAIACPSLSQRLTLLPDPCRA